MGETACWTIIGALATALVTVFSLYRAKDKEVKEVRDSERKTLEEENRMLRALLEEMEGSA